MQSHQERVFIEKDELGTKTHKLQAFISGSFFCSLDTAEQVRLRLQLTYMRLYEGVLMERIAAFREEK